MTRTAAYTLCFSFPFNKETTAMYSSNEEIMNASINHTLQSLELIASSHGFFSMETLMKYFGLRPTRHCPGINFTRIMDFQMEYDEINQTDILTIWVTNDMRLRPVIRYRMPELDEAEKFQMTDVKFPDEEKEEPEACQTGPKETSESVENDKT